MIGACLGYICGLEVGTSVCNKLGFSDGKVIETALGAMDGILLRTYYGIVLIYLEGLSEVILKSYFEGLLMFA